MTPKRENKIKKLLMDWHIMAVALQEHEHIETRGKVGETMEMCARAIMFNQSQQKVTGEPMTRIKLSSYTIIAMSGPDGHVAIAYMNGSSIVKSINRIARSLVGKPRRPAQPTRVDAPTLGSSWP